MPPRYFPNTIFNFQLNGHKFGFVGCLRLVIVPRTQYFYFIFVLDLVAGLIVAKKKHNIQ